MSPNASLSTQPTSTTEIAARAREIWMQEGCPDGHDVEHWLKAEAQIRAEKEFSGQHVQLRDRSPRNGAIK